MSVGIFKIESMLIAICQCIMDKSIDCKPTFNNKKTHSPIQCLSPVCTACATHTRAPHIHYVPTFADRFLYHNRLCWMYTTTHAHTDRYSLPFDSFLSAHLPWPGMVLKHGTLLCQSWRDGRCVNTLHLFRLSFIRSFVIQIDLLCLSISILF